MRDPRSLRQTSVVFTHAESQVKSQVESQVESRVASQVDRRVESHLARRLSLAGSAGNSGSLATGSDAASQANRHTAAGHQPGGHGRARAVALSLDARQRSREAGNGWILAVAFAVLLVASFISSQSALAQSIRDGAPEAYIVKKGDTLWGIADMFLEEPWLWPEVWDVNPQIDNPHLIFPGDTIYLSYVDGRPVLTLARGRDVKLTPNMRVTPLDLAIPVIPLDQIGAFLMRHRILGVDEFESSAYVVAGGQDHLITANGDTIFGRGYFPDDERAYGIYRSGDIYRDPITLEILGYQAQDIGNAQAKSSLSDPVVELEITRVTEEVRITDRLLPLEERILDATFQPRAPGVPVEDAFMIAVDGGVSQIGTTDIVVINKGAREGMEVGNVLAIYQTGAVVFDEVARNNVQLPDERAGLAMIFEVAEKASYALVLKANRPLKVMDKVKNP